MGIINAAPDSFYQASRTLDEREAAERALMMHEEGADLIDVGGQSTRPGSDRVPLDEEIRRAIPAVRAAAKAGLPVSIDTDRAAVARLARLAGASILNDVSALRTDPGMAQEAARFDAVILMHRGGKSPKTMQDSPSYDDVFSEVRDFLAERIEFFARCGGERSRVIIDPGIGFGKTAAHNLSLLKRLQDLSQLAPVAVGVSRKSFFAAISPDSGPQDRLPASLAVASWAALAGAAIIRAHDVGPTRKALSAIWAVRSAC
ncbi:MAG: dihydropteroate synthase [Elusimicrobiota bacterium]